MKSSIFCFIFLFLFIYSGVTWSQSSIKKPGAIPYGMNPKAGRYIKIRDLKMYVEIYGKGNPMLVIHGNGGSMASMDNQIAFFTGSHQVIAADSRAQGRSTDDRDSLSYELMADDCNALLDSLHNDSALVIGWSDGGIIGLLLAIRHPDKVKKLAITGANIRPDTTAISAADFQSMIDFVNLLKQQPKNENSRNKIKLTQLMIDEPNIGYKELQKIHCPVLVIGGDHDIIKPEHTLEIFRSIPHAKLWILPGSGHETCITFKEDFNEQVRRFFEVAK